MSTDQSPPQQVNPYAREYASFVEQTRDHRLVVLHDCGMYRHLRVQAPDTRMWSWDLTTWPGHLTTSGDVSAGYTFTREEDMLRFFSFAGKGSRQYSDGAPQIDLHYWAQKLVGRGYQDVMVYSEDVFMQSIHDLLDEHDELSLEAIAEIREEDDDLADNRAAQRARYIEYARDVSDYKETAIEFLRNRAGDGVVYEDWYEVGITTFDTTFLYACWAIELSTRLWADYLADKRAKSTSAVAATSSDSAMNSPVD